MSLTEVVVNAVPMIGGGEIVWLERRRAPPGFTARDVSELERWARCDRRFVVWESQPAPFAMLYHGRTPWASWAVARHNEELLVWDCVTFADVGRFSSMLEALSTLSGTGGGWAEPVSNVIPFVMCASRPTTTSDAGHG